VERLDNDMSDFYTNPSLTSYWLGEKSALPLSPIKPLKVRDAYLDIAVALTLLEERIESNLPPSEGIVLVREHRQQAS
jgi:hypothetical protein